MMETYKTKFKFRVETNVLEEFSKKYQAIYDKYMFNGHVYDQINLKEEGISEKDQIFFSKGVENPLTPTII